MFDIWKIKFPELLNECEHLFLVKGTGIHLSKYSSNELNLVCDHEDADTYMFAYCRYILNNNPQISRVIISATDTDVAITSCYQYSVALNSLDEFWFKTGTGKYKRYIVIHETAWSLGHDICRLLPAFHTTIRYDSVCSFHDIGKKSKFSVPRNFSCELLEMKEFRTDVILSLITILLLLQPELLLCCTINKIFWI